MAIKKYRLMAGLFTFVFIAIQGKVLYLQTVQKSFLTEKALKQRAYNIPLKSHRGNVTDRNGKLLALSIPVYDIYSDSRYIENKNQAAKAIADYFKLNQKDVLDKINKNYYSVLVKNVDEKTLNNFKKIKPKGISYYRTDSRYYPNDTVLGKELGAVGDDNNALSGIELGLNRYLKGIDGVDLSEKDRYGNSIDMDNKNVQKPVDGKDVSLTIDYNIQYQAEKFLKDAVDKNGAKKGTSIVMNPSDGSILAIADYPQINPNNFKDYKTDDFAIPSIAMSYEPGSTFKPITVSIAETLHLINDKGDRFVDNNNFNVDGFTIHAWNHKGFGAQTAEEVLMNSSNAGAAQIGLRVPSNTFRQYLCNLGLDKKTQVDISGEGNPIFPNKSEFEKRITRATVSFGQGISVTPVQLISAECAVVNGGHTVTPHIVSATKDANSDKFVPYKLPEQKQVISKDASDKVKWMLKSVVDRGTAKPAQISGYNVGGKTGTAQIAENGKYITGRNIVSFLGFAPVENPQIICLTVLDSPKDSDQVGGGTMAGPVVKNIFQYSLPYLGIKPNYIKSQPMFEAQNYINKTREYIQNNPPSYQYEFKGTGDLIVDQQYDSSGGNLKVVFTTEELFKKGYLTMPDLIGCDYNTVCKIFKNNISSIVFNGDKTKKVNVQDTPPGTKIQTNDKIVLWMN